MPDRAGERRALYQSIVDDPAASHSERMRADEMLTELDARAAAHTSTESMSAAEALELAESWALAVPGVLVCARVAAGLDPGIEPPVERADVLEVVHLQQRVIAELERRLQQRELALQSWTTQRRLLGP
jgi:hypothetical protein